MPPRRSGQLGRSIQLPPDPSPDYRGQSHNQLHSLKTLKPSSASHRSGNLENLENDCPDSLKNLADCSHGAGSSTYNARAKAMAMAKPSSIVVEPVAAHGTNNKTKKGFVSYGEYYHNQWEEQDINQDWMDEPHFANNAANLYLEQANVKAQACNDHWHDKVLDPLDPVKCCAEEKIEIFQEKNITGAFIDIIEEVVELTQLSSTVVSFVINSSTHAYDFIFTILGLAIATIKAVWEIIVIIDRTFSKDGKLVVGMVTRNTSAAHQMAQSYNNFFSGATDGKHNALYNLVVNANNLVISITSLIWNTFRDSWNDSMVLVGDVGTNAVQVRATGAKWYRSSRPPLSKVFQFVMSWVLGYFHVDGYRLYDRIEQLSHDNSWFLRALRALNQLRKFACQSIVTVIAVVCRFITHITGVYVLQRVGLTLPQLKSESPGISKKESLGQYNNNGDGRRVDQPNRCQYTIEALVPTLKYVPEHAAVIMVFHDFNMPAPTLDWQLERKKRKNKIPRGKKLTLPVQDEEIIRIYENKWRTYELQRASYNEREHARLINDAADTIIWCIRLGISTLTLYERLGYLASEHDRLIAATNAKMSALKGTLLELSPDFIIRLHSPSLNVTSSFNRSFSHTDDDYDGYGYGDDDDNAASTGYHYGMNVILLKENPDNVATVSDYTRKCVDTFDSEEALIPGLFKCLGGNAANPSLLIFGDGSNTNSQGFPLYCLKNTFLFQQQQDPLNPSFEDTFMRGLVAYANEISEMEAITPIMDHYMSSGAGSRSGRLASISSSTNSYRSTNPSAAERLARAQHVLEKSQTERAPRYSPIHPEEYDHELDWSEE